jgi:hypothetical protein
MYYSSERERDRGKMEWWAHIQTSYFSLLFISTFRLCKRLWTDRFSIFGMSAPSQSGAALSVWLHSIKFLSDIELNSLVYRRESYVIVVRLYTQIFYFFFRVRRDYVCVSLGWLRSPLSFFFILFCCLNFNFPRNNLLKRQTQTALAASVSRWVVFSFDSKEKLDVTFMRIETC